MHDFGLALLALHLQHTHNCNPFPCPHSRLLPVPLVRQSHISVLEHSLHSYHSWIKKNSHRCTHSSDIPDKILTLQPVNQAHRQRHIPILNNRFLSVVHTLAMKNGSAEKTKRNSSMKWNNKDIKSWPEVTQTLLKSATTQQLSAYSGPLHFLD